MENSYVRATPLRPDPEPYSLGLRLHGGAEHWGDGASAIGGRPGVGRRKAAYPL